MALAVNAELLLVAVGCRRPPGTPPFHMGPYRPGKHRDRHNREYTPAEVRLLLADAGYKVVEMITRDDTHGQRQRRLRRLVRYSRAWLRGV